MSDTCNICHASFVYRTLNAHTQRVTVYRVAQKGAQAVTKAAALDKGERGRDAHGDKSEDKEIKALAKQMRQVCVCVCVVEEKEIKAPARRLSF